MFFRNSRLLLLVLPLVAVLASGTVQAAVTAVDLGKAGDPQPLGAYLLMLDDPSGRLDVAGVEAAYRAGRMRPLPSARPSLGHREGATWLRFELDNSLPVERDRWLELDWLFQQFYDLYLVDADGQSSHLANGSSVPIASRPVASRNILFPLRLSGGQHQTAYLRIAGGFITIVDLSLWTPAAFLEYRTRYMALKYLGIGSTALVVVFSVLAWRALDRPGLLAMVPGQALTMLLALSGDGFIQDLIAPDNSVFWNEAWVQRSRLLVTFSLALCHVVFARSFLDLPRQAPRLNRLWPLLIAACFLGIALSPWGTLVPWPQVLTAFISGSLTLTALLMACRRGSPGLSYLAAWGSLWLAVLVRMIQALGLFSGIPFLNESWLVGLLGSSLALTYALFLETETVRHAARAAQEELLALEQRQSERLAQAVEERTAQLLLATERAEAANKAKSGFLSMISHDFRTPLHAILSYTRLLQDRYTEGELSRMLAFIERSGTQLLRLIDGILQFSRGGSTDIVLDAKPVSLASLGRSLAATGQVLADERGNRLLLMLDPALPEVVEVDEQRILQVLLNLLGNACKFTCRGTVQLRIFPAGPPEPSPEGTVRQRLRFEVEDDGIGIPLEDQGRIFAPFEQGQLGQRYSGVGLGLAICRQLVRLMGCDIELKSQPGRGSCFGFTLDVALADGEAVPDLSAEGHGKIMGYEGPERTLLVVDDISDNREILRDLCTEWGFRVVLAADGQEALAKWVVNGLPGIDAVLVDQFMPNGSGWDLLLAIRNLPGPAHHPVILVSAAPPELPPDFPPNLRFDGVLLKPDVAKPLAGLLQILLGVTWRRRGPFFKSEFSLARLPPERIDEFKSMVEVGRIVALEHWAAALALDLPECADLAAEIKRLAESANLGGLQRLLDAP